MLEDSLKKRYIYKLSTGIIAASISVVIQAIVPRSLGPKYYGDLSFLTNFFQQVIAFFDLWTSPCFFIKFSQRLKDLGLVLFTYGFVGTSSIIILSIFLFIPAESSIYSIIWPDQEYSYIIYAAIFSLMIWVSKILTDISDAFGLTAKSEILRLIQKTVILVFIYIFYYLNKLNIETYFYLQYFTIFILILLFIWIIQHNRKIKWVEVKLSIIKIKHYSLEFYDFSSPLFLVGLLGLITSVLDRWLLQKYGGSVEQGFFGVSNQVGIVCLLFTGAMTPLIMREFSIASSRKDIVEVSRLFKRYVPLFFSIAAYISCFLTLQADKVAYILGGSAYKNASVAVAVMCLYPIHQTYGQLNGSVLMATGQTNLYGKIGSVFMILGLPLTYFLVAAKNQMGLDAGATGLALKMVIIQFIGVNVQLYFVTKFLKIKFSKHIVHQLVSVSSLIFFSFLALFAEQQMFTTKGNVVVRFMFSGLIYSIMVLTLLNFQPNVFGLNRIDINNVKFFLTKYFKTEN